MKQRTNQTTCHFLPSEKCHIFKKRCVVGSFRRKLNIANIIPRKNEQNFLAQHKTRKSGFCYMDFIKSMRCEARKRRNVRRTVSTVSVSPCSATKQLAILERTNIRGRRAAHLPSLSHQALQKLQSRELFRRRRASLSPSMTEGR